MLRTEHTAKRTTIREIAEKAKTSSATVSRVLNGGSGVDPETRERVLKIADELGYDRTRLRAAPDGGGSYALYLPARYQDQGPHVYTDQIVGSVFGALHDEGHFATLLGPKHVRPSQLKRLKEESLGLFLLRESERLTELEKELLEQGIPTVILGMVFDSLDKYPHATYVTLDNRASARLAVGYLHGEFHHMRIAHLAGPASRFSAKERLDGYRSALLEYGLDTAHIFEPDADNWYQISGYESMRRLTQRCQEASRPLPTAIFAANDFIAWGAIRYLEESGRRVPQDVSVIGHDAYPIREATGLTSAVTPITLLRLTSIDHRLKDYGAVGLQMLRSLAEGRPALPISLAPHLVEGDTCQEAPTDHENGLGLA